MSGVSQVFDNLQHGNRELSCEAIASPLSVWVPYKLATGSIHGLLATVVVPRGTKSGSTLQCHPQNNKLTGGAKGNHRNQRGQGPSGLHHGWPHPKQALPPSRPFRACHRLRELQNEVQNRNQSNPCTHASLFLNSLSKSG